MSLVWAFNLNHPGPTKPTMRIIETLRCCLFLLDFLFISVFFINSCQGDVGTAAQYNPPYLPTICYGNDASEFPSSNLFAAAGDGIWDNGASCGRQYLVRCISARSLALVFLTRLFRSRLWIMLLRHLQRRQLMAPPSFYRRRRLGSLPIQPPRPSTLNFNRCDMGTYAGEAYNSISSLKPGKEKNGLDFYSPEPSSQGFKLRRVCDREPREEIGPTRTCRVKKK
ncbi:hypothetical protein CK203_013325 [Vitis vinifera]|uniref:Expansin-like EG45 domain-containing protein n=1 Tax=Vitis vinifera TaxID=29760 RepID=A0A438JQA5_VITVI|nr:hypothetical protein CK203_013325 [Vitis vinifera]